MIGECVGVSDGATNLWWWPIGIYWSGSNRFRSVDGWLEGCATVLWQWLRHSVATWCGRGRCNSAPVVAGQFVVVGKAFWAVGDLDVAVLRVGCASSRAR